MSDSGVTDVVQSLATTLSLLETSGVNTIEIVGGLFILQSLVLKSVTSSYPAVTPFITKQIGKLMQIVNKEQLEMHVSAVHIRAIKELMGKKPVGYLQVIENWLDDPVDYINSVLNASRFDSPAEDMLNRLLKDML